MSTYLYGVTHSSHPLTLERMTGVGANKPSLRAVRWNDVAAVVSDAPDDLRARRRDLEAHHRILQSLGADGTVLPMRFGTVAADDSAIRTELESSAAHYRELLTQLAGKIELNVKATHRQDAILRALLLEQRPLRDCDNALRAGGGGTYAQRVRFGEQLASALAERRVKDAGHVVARLEPHACQMRLGAEAGGFVNASFLVGATTCRAFEATFTELLLVPFAPARLALWSVGQVVDSARREYHDPAAIRRELAELSRRFDEGLMSAEEFESREDQLLDRLGLEAEQ
jgi:hypothetical protein